MRSEKSRTLSDVLDYIWNSKKPRIEAAADQLPIMQEGDIDSIVSLLIRSVVKEILVDTALENGKSYLLKKYSGNLENVLRVASLNSADNALRIPDLNFELHPQVAMKELPLEINAVQILAALQYSRDHLDTLLYYDRSEREKALSQQATALKIPADLFRAIVRNSASVLRQN